MIALSISTDTYQPSHSDLKSRAFDIYQLLREQFAADQLFLLESMGKHAVDSRSSVIGVSPLFSIRIKGVKVLIEGKLLPEMIPSFLKAFPDITKTNQTNQTLTYFLKAKKDVWNFLRQVEQLFQSHEQLFFYGYFSYATISYIEQIDLGKSEAPDQSDIYLTLYQTQIQLTDNHIHITQITNDGVAQLPHIKALIQSALQKTNKIQDISNDAYQVRRETSKASFLEKCQIALHHVSIGDVYQIQIGQKVEITSNLPPQTAYARMRELNPSPYMYLFSDAGHTFVGASPEMFIRIENNQEVLLRPIAGTLGKKTGLTYEQAKQHLHENEKEVAEHLMLVDLSRNDLSRACDASTVKVENLLSIEEYSHVYHMVSSTHGQLKAGYDKYDMLQAAFPAGTMTGAPKIKAMEIIQTLEDSPRNFYAGCIGLLGVGHNNMNTALCIRTAFHYQDTYTLRACAGIVADSQIEAEYQETLHKMGAVFRVITGKELTGEEK
jgi:anthranilate synthase component 1